MACRIVASAAVREPADVARAAVACGDDADLLELRADGWRGSAEELAAAIRAAARPTLATVRPRWEGGTFPGGEEARRRLLEAAARTATWVDVEARAAFVRQTFAPARKLVSWHDFEETPRHLRAALHALRQAAPDAGIVKLATTARHLDDVGRLADLARADRAAGGRPELAILAMGEVGQPLRLLAGRVGSALTYGALPGFEATAAGQTAVADLARRFRVREQGATTPVAAVVGNPIRHSLSPLLHNALYAALDAGRPLERVFVPLLAERLDEALAVADSLGIDGLSVTLPFKEAAARAATGAPPGFPWPPPEGAVNTLLRRGDRWLAANTDRLGFREALDHGAPGADHSGQRALVLGAGGVARTVVAVLRELGCEVTIASRTRARADDLARTFRATVVDLAGVVASGFALVVNATPVGMDPQAGLSPLPDGALRAGQVVMDLVYRPRRTRLLEQAAAAGARGIDGLEMFLGQALAQFELFTGRKGDARLARAVVEQAL